MLASFIGLWHSLDMSNATQTRPLYTITFEAANGHQETQHCWDWKATQAALNSYRSRGWKVVAYVDRDTPENGQHD